MKLLNFLKSFALMAMVVITSGAGKMPERPVAAAANDQFRFYDDFESYDLGMLLPVASDNTWLLENITQLRYSSVGAYTSNFTNSVISICEGTRSLAVVSTSVKATVGTSFPELNRGYVEVSVFNRSTSTMISLVNGNKHLIKLVLKVNSAIYINDQLIPHGYEESTWERVAFYFENGKGHIYFIKNNTYYEITQAGGESYLYNLPVNGLKLGNVDGGGSYFDNVLIQEGYSALPTSQVAPAVGGVPRFVQTSFVTNFNLMQLEYILEVDRLDTTIHYIIVDDPNPYTFEDEFNPRPTAQDIIAGVDFLNKRILEAGTIEDYYYEGIFDLTGIENMNLAFYGLVTSEAGSNIVSRTFNIMITPIDSFTTMNNVFRATPELTGLYILTSDIDCNWAEIMPYGTFRGVLFGNGYAIKNLSIKGAAGALFTKAKNALIQDLIMSDVHTNGNGDGDAILIAVSEGNITLDNISMRNCSVNVGSSVAAARNGTVVGRHSGGDNVLLNNISVVNCTIHGYQYGGLVFGHIEKGLNIVFSNIYVNGTISYSDQTSSGVLGRIKGGKDTTNILISEVSVNGLVINSKNRHSAIVSKQEGGTLRVVNAFANPGAFTNHDGTSFPDKEKAIVLGGFSGDAEFNCENIYATVNGYSTYSTSAKAPGDDHEYVVSHQVVALSAVNQSWLMANLPTFDPQLWTMVGNVPTLQNAIF